MVPPSVGSQSQPPTPPTSASSKFSSETSTITPTPVKTPSAQPTSAYDRYMQETSGTPAVVTPPVATPKASFIDRVNEKGQRLGGSLDAGVLEGVSGIVKGFQWAGGALAGAFGGNKITAKASQEALQQKINDQTKLLDFIKEQKKIGTPEAINKANHAQKTLDIITKELSNNTAQDFPMSMDFIAGTPKITKTADKIQAWADAVKKSNNITPENQTFAEKAFEGVGSSIPYYLPAIGIARGASVLANVSPRVAMLFGGSASAALESMGEAGQVYETVKKEKGIDAARDASTKTFWANALLLSLTENLGVFNPEVKGVLKKALISMPIEGFQESVQQVIQNVNSGRPIWEGVKEAGIIGGIVGGVLGGTTDLVAPNENPEVPPVKIPDGERVSQETPATGSAFEKFQNETKGIDLTRPAAEIQSQIEEAARKGAAEAVAAQDKSSKADQGKAAETTQKASTANIERPATSKEAADRYFKDVLKNSLEGNAYVIGADDLKDHFGGDYADARHTEIYSKATFDLYKKGLKLNKGDKVILTGGGAGAGKTELVTSGLIAGGFDGVLYDSNLSSIQGAKNAIAEARKAGKDVEIYGVLPNLEKARGFTISRENRTGRGISDETFARGHSGFPAVVRQLIEEKIINPDNVHLLDTRNINTFEEAFDMVANQHYVKDPLATVKSLGYTKEDLQKNYAKEHYDTKTAERRSAVPSGEGSRGTPSQDRANQENANGGGNESVLGKNKSEKIKEAEEVLKNQIGDIFKIVEPVGNLWKSKGNVLFISLKTEKTGFAAWLRQKNFIVSAQEAGNNIFKVEVKVPEKTPTNGIVGASIGKFREEGGGDIKLGNFEQIKPIEFPELLSFAKDLSGSEVFIKNYKSANGMFYGADARIGLNPDLFKAGNIQQLQKTMAHEIGHLIDYLPEKTLARGNVLGRLAVLRDFHKDFYAKAGASRTNKEVTDQLWALSKYWKPIDESTASKSFLSYRKSAAEVYADFISVMFNNPKLAGEMAPTAYNIFFEQLDAKPKVKAAYFELQDFLRNGEKVAQSRKDKTQNMFVQADQISKDRQHQLEIENEQKKKSLWFLFKFQNVSRFESFREKVKALEKKGVYVNPDDNPVYFLEESNYIGGKIKAEVDTRFNTIYQELQNNGLTWDDLGEITFYERILKGDRAEVANPEGLQIDFVQELYDGFEGVAPDPTNSKKGTVSMRAQLGDEKFAKLQALAVQYRQQIKDLYKEAYDAGLLPTATWDMIEKNDYYVPFKPIKYGGTKTNYRIKQQKGTLSAIENPANTGIEKSVSLIRAVEKNKVNKASIDFLKAHYPEELQEAKYAFNGKTRIALEPLDKDMRLVRYMEDGKMKAYYVDKYIGEALQKTPVGHSNLIIQGLRFMNSTLFRPLFITFNTGFQSFNLVRDALRFWKNVPDMTLIKTIKLYAKSARAAKVRAFGISENASVKDRAAYDLINKLEEDRVLSITYNDMIKGEDVEDKQIDRIMRETGVREAQSTKLGRLGEKFGITKKTPVIKQIIGIMDFIEKTGNLIESMPKIAGYYALEGKLPPAEMRSYVRRKVGSPDFLDGGKFKPVINEVFLFSNAIFQGIRSDYEVATDPKTRSGYWWKTAQANIVPKILMTMAAAGLFGDELEKLFGKVSEYDKTNYTVVPLGTDQNGKAVYIRIPSDETGRLISGLFWKISQAAQDPKKLADADTYTNILAYAGGQAPSISPSVTAIYNVGTFLSGQNPYDFFRGRNVLTDEQMTAGGAEKWKPFLSYMFDNLGGATFTKLYTNETVPKNPTLSERVVALPVVSNVLGRWLKVSDYGETEKLKEITGEVDKKKAKEALENRRTVFDAVDAAQGKSYAEANKIKHDMIKAVVGIPNTPEKRALAQSLANRFDKLRVRGSADRNVDALITAQSNEAKVALLKEFEKNMSTQDFADLKKFIIKNRVVSSAAYQQFLRERVQK